MASLPSRDAASSAVRTDVIIDCSHTRYHVVRAAARMVGWSVKDANTTEAVPPTYHGVVLASEDDGARAHPPQVQWIDTSAVVSRVAGLRPYERLNHFTGMGVIARKAHLFRRLMSLSRLASRSARNHPDNTSPLLAFFEASVPPSFSSVGDLGRLACFQKELETSTPASSAPYYIVKPNLSCQGRGIRLSRSPLDELTAGERTEKKEECVVQLYLDRPLLWEGKKFDLRLYVLLTSVTSPTAPSRRRLTRRGEAEVVEAAAADTDRFMTAPSSRVPAVCEEGAAAAAAAAALPPPAEVEGVRLYVHREGLVRICAEPYAAPTEENCTRAVQHFTNYAVNKQSALFKPARSGETANCDDGGDNGRKEEGNKRSLAALADFVDAMKAPGGWLAVQRRIDQCITLTVLSGVDVLRREMIGAGGARGDRADACGCFELLGFDILLREGSLQPVVMEVNHSPSLFCDSTFDFAVKSTVLRDTFHLLQTRMPPWEAYQGNSATYAACTRPGSRAAARMAEAEASLLRSTETLCGFRSLLPHYGGAGYGEDGVKGVVADWQHEERVAQINMVRLSQQLL